MRDVIYEMSSKGLGMTCVVDDGDALLGIITDGDLRRHMERVERYPRHDRRRRHDARSRVDGAPGTLAVEALNIMEQRKITSIVVVDGAAGRVARRRAPARPVAHGDGLGT